ncbi:unnamed protein product [Jaminaea pallidilutea]
MRAAHSSGTGSVSGAGLWLASGSGGDIATVLGQQAPEPSSSSSSQSERAPRTYHINAEAAAAGARSSAIGAKEWDLVSRGLVDVRPRSQISTTSDPVDLDLSFDFISQSSHGQRQTAVAGSPETVSCASDESGAPTASTSATQSTSPVKPKGMSESSSVARKRPPKPLSLANKKQQDGNLSTADSPSLASHSAAVSPVPLSATRRGHDANVPEEGRRSRSKSISSTQAPPERLPPPLSPLPPIPSSSKAPHASSVDSGMASNVVRQQRLRRAQEQLQERMHRASFIRTEASKPRSSFGPSVVPVKPVQAQDRAADKKQGVPSPIAATGNALGLHHSASLASPVTDDGFAPSSPDVSGANITPQTDLNSTPGTAFSSIFDSRYGGPPSEASKATSVDGGDRDRFTFGGVSAKILEQGGGVPMSRGSTNVIEETIREEDASALRSLNKGLARSDTAEWIRSQSEAKFNAQRSSNRLPSPQMKSSAAQACDVPTIAGSDFDGGSEAGHESRNRRAGDSAQRSKRQSVVLLDAAQAHDGVGLGLFFESNAEDSADQTCTKSDVRPESATLAPNGALSSQNSASSVAASGSFESSPSSSSKDEGFACNVTPSMPKAAFLTDDGKNAGRQRFPSKIWRHSARSPRPESAALPIRPLELVERNEADIKKTRRESLRRHSLQVNRLVTEPIQVADTPLTAPLKSEPVFPTAAVPTAFEQSRRSAKHVRRQSRIQYISDANKKELRLDMPDSADGEDASEQQDQLTALRDDEPKRVRVSSPTMQSDELPAGQQGSRHSWGLLSRVRSPLLRSTSLDDRAKQTSPVSPLLDFNADGSGLRDAQERAEILSRQKPQHSSIDMGQASSSTLRRRSLQERGSSGSLAPPPTATIRPFSLRNSHRRSDAQQSIATGETVRLAGIDERRESGLRDLQLKADLPQPVPEEAAEPARMSIFVPIEALQAHLRRRQLQRAETEAQQPQSPATRPNAQDQTAHEVTPRFASNKKVLVGGSGALQYSAGRLLDIDQPSRALFFAGFLCMPWLWLIGGWWLANDGMMLPPNTQQVQFWRHEASMERSEPFKETQRGRPRRSRTSSGRSRPSSRIPSPEREALPRAPAQAYTDSSSAVFLNRIVTEHAEASTMESGSSLPRLAQSAPSGTLRSARSNPTLRSSTSHFSTASSGTRSPRVLVGSDPTKIPLRTRRSLGSMLNPHPEVSLYQSPVRSGEIDGSVEDLVSRRSKLTFTEEDEGESSSPDDSGVDLSEPEADSTAEDTAPSASRWEGETDVMHRSRTYAARSVQLGSRYRQSTMLERFSSTDRYIMLNRLMAVISTIGVFAAMGVALNAVAMGF